MTGALSYVFEIFYVQTCVEVAESRTLNWQKFCMSDETVLPFIIKISFLVDNGVSPFLLQLLQAALCPQPKDKNRQNKEVVFLSPGCILCIFKNREDAWIEPQLKIAIKDGRESPRKRGLEVSGSQIYAAIQKSKYSEFFFWIKQITQYLPH